MAATLARLTTTRRRVEAALLLSLWLGLAVVAASEQIHRWLHNEASSLQHQCVFTLLSKSQLLVSQAATWTTPLPPPGLTAAIIRDSAPGPSADYRFSPSRAPPRSLSRHLIVGRPGASG